MLTAKIDFAKWEDLFEKKIAEVATADDPAHDLLHFQRVVQVAKRICVQEGGKLEVVIPAAWLHDLVIVPKNHPERSFASRLSAEAALGVGAIGIARCFAVAGMLRRPLYCAEDPFCEKRQADDQQYTVDHFYTKLFKTIETLKTATGRSIGDARAAQMRGYLEVLRQEIHGI